MTLDEALSGLDFPSEVRETLAIVNVPYLSFAGVVEEGQLVVHKDLAEDLPAIFADLVELKFPIEKIVPIVAYGWDDEASMRDNNSSAFNYRVIYGTDRLSNHSFGRAIDVNTLINPYVGEAHLTHLPGLTYNPETPGTFVDGSPAVAAFLARGYIWGGHWQDRKDYQHFEKRV